jgi:hypothetical protein
MKPGTAAVLALLRERESVTPHDALRELHQFRLGARILELRQAGHNISCDRSEGYGRYRLHETPRQLALLDERTA